MLASVLIEKLTARIAEVGDLHVVQFDNEWDAHLDLDGYADDDANAVIVTKRLIEGKRIGDDVIEL